MASQGPNVPSTTADDASVGTKGWINTSNVSASDNVYASVANNHAPTTSHYIKCTNFGFSIPGGSTINGITVEVERKKTGTGTVKDNIVKLVKGGTISGTDKADTATAWPTSDAYATYGSSSDLWGLSLTDTDVNDSTFGVAISTTLTNSKLAVTANVDHIRMTVTYTAGGGGGSQTNAILFAND